MTTSVPSYSDSAIAPTTDSVLKAAKQKFPVTAQELAAEEAAHAADLAYQKFLARVGKHVIDAGSREGAFAGWGFQPDRFDAEEQELRAILERALVKLNGLRLARQRRIQIEVDAVNAKAAAAWQAAWRKRHGIAEPEREEPRCGVAA